MDGSGALIADAMSSKQKIERTGQPNRTAESARRAVKRTVVL